MDAFAGLSGDLARVYSTADVVDGHLARGRLESEGIPVIVEGMGDGPYRMGPVHLYVPVELEAEARAILSAVAAPEAEPSPSG